MKDTIKVKVDGETIVLDGQVRSDQEKRLAENMLRLTPGVHQVQNNLQVVQTAPAPRLTP
jgi:osmotically-inducible protein OsmY